MQYHQLRSVNDGGDNGGDDDGDDDDGPLDLSFYKTKTPIQLSPRSCDASCLEQAREEGLTSNVGTPPWWLLPSTIPVACLLPQVLTITDSQGQDQTDLVYQRLLQRVADHRAGAMNPVNDDEDAVVPNENFDPHSDANSCSSSSSTGLTGSGSASCTITSLDSSSSQASGVLLPSGLSAPTHGAIRMHRSRTRNHGPTHPHVRRCLLSDRINVAEVRSGSVTKPLEGFAQRPIIVDQENCHQTPCSSRTAEAANKRKAVKPRKMMEHSPGTTNNEQRIMNAVSRSSAQPNLIGDFTVPEILPLVTGRHQDLKYISGETLVGLLRGDFRQQVASCEIIDCRYPFEFDGGHIPGAKNLFTRNKIIEGLLLVQAEQQPTTITTTTRRNILVFHCEFSFQRAPTLLRFLRNYDRNLNVDRYPALHYPEVYLLKGGYEQFYKSYSSLCDPIGYRPMRHCEYVDECRYYRLMFNNESPIVIQSRLSCHGADSD